MQTLYTQLLRQLAEQNGLNAASLVASQMLTLEQLDIGFYCDGDDQQGDLAFFACLCKLPEAGLAQFGREMLEANNLWSSSFGYVLGLQHGTDTVVLNGRVALERSDARSLGAALNHFMNVAHAWRAHLLESKGRPESLPRRRRSPPSSPLPLPLLPPLQ